MKFDLEFRLIEFATSVIEVIELLPENKACNHLSNQLVRSGTAPALMYGEAQSAESRKDFIHKMKLALKELQETRVCLKILERKNYLQSPGKLKVVLDESDELVLIFAKSVGTAEKNSNGIPRSST